MHRVKVRMNVLSMALMKAQHIKALYIKALQRELCYKGRK